MLSGFLMKKGEYKKNVYIFLRILSNLADALQLAHSRSIMHLNIKPTNVLINLQKHLLENNSVKFDAWSQMLARSPDNEFLLTNFGHPITFDLKETNLNGEAFKLAFEDIKSFWPPVVVEMVEILGLSRDFNERGLRIPPLMSYLGPNFDIYSLGLLGIFILSGGSYLLLKSQELDFNIAKKLSKESDFFPGEFLEMAYSDLLVPMTSAFTKEMSNRQFMYMEEVSQAIRDLTDSTKRLSELMNNESPDETLRDFAPNSGNQEKNSMNLVSGSENVVKNQKKTIEEFAAEGEITSGELLAYKADMTIEELVRRNKPHKKVLVGSEEQRVAISKKVEKKSHQRPSGMPKIIIKHSDPKEFQDVYEREENIRRNNAEIDEIINADWLVKSASNFINEILSKRQVGARHDFYTRYLSWKLGKITPRDITLRKEEHPLLVGMIYYFSQSFNNALEYFKRAIPVTEDSKYFLLVDLLKKSFVEAIKPKKDTKYLMGHRASSDIFDIKASYNNVIGASVARHERLILWNFKERVVIAPIDDPRITVMDMDDKGNFVVGGRNSGTLFVVAIETHQITGEFIHKLNEFEGSHGASVNSLAISAEGSICVSGALGQSHILVWNVKRRRSFAKIALEHPVAGLKVNKIGSLVAAAERYSSELKVYKFEGPDRLYELIRRLGPHTSYVTHVLISIDDQVVAVACVAKELSFWRLRDQVLLRKIRVPGLILGLSATPMLKYIMISLPQRVVLYESFTGIFWKDFEMHGNSSGAGVAIRNQNYLFEFTRDGAEEFLTNYLVEFQQNHKGEMPSEEDLKRFFLPDASEIFNPLPNDEEQLKFIHYVFKRRGDFALGRNKGKAKMPKLNLYYADWRDSGSMIFHKRMEIPFNGLLFTSSETETSPTFVKAEIMKVKLLRLLETKEHQNDQTFNMVRFLEHFEPELVKEQLYCKCLVPPSFNRLHSSSLVKTISLAKKKKESSDNGLSRVLRTQNDWVSKGEFGGELEGEEEEEDQIPFHVALSTVDKLHPEHVVFITSDKQIVLLSLKEMKIIFQKDLETVPIKPFKREYYDDILWGFKQFHKVTTIAYSQGSHSVFCGFETGYCSVLNIQNMECIRSLRAHQCYASASVFSEKIHAFVSGGYDYNIMIWTNLENVEPQVYKG